MKIQIQKILALFFISLMISTYSFGNSLTISNNTDFNLNGIWQGSLKISNVSLRIVFKVTQDKNGSYSATMDSPDQGAKDIPVDSVIYNDGNVKFVVGAVRGYFEGKVDFDNSIIKGEWHQSSMSLPLELKKIDKVEELKRPQEPKPPFPYNVEDVSYENKTAGIELAGTLTYPKSKEPFPAVLLITGSGPQNRDEELFGHKPFLVIADYLTRRGIAVLRVDDRGIGKSTGNFSTATTKDFASDVLAGVEFLKSNENINPKEIGLIGHSEGGLIAPMVAVKSNDVAFIVLMAGPGLPGDQILYKQVQLISRLGRIPEAKIKRSLALNKEMYNIIKESKDSSETAAELHKVYNNYYNNLDEKEKTEMGDSNVFFNKELKTIMSPWFKFFISYDPVPTLEKVKCPVLALDGSKDVQVPPKEDLEAIKKALEEGGNKNFETLELNGLNHLFQTAETGSPSEYGKIEETLSPKALKVIGDWILKVVRNN